MASKTAISLAVMVIWILHSQYHTKVSADSPQYTIVHTDSSFEVRLYRPSAWMIASLHRQASFRLATYTGAHKLYQYIQGANMNSSRIPLSFPVLTGIVPQSGPFESSSYTIRFYLPLNFQDSPPVPLADLHLQVEYWSSSCVAIRKFSGFAVDEIIAEEAYLLETSLKRSPWANVTMGVSRMNHDAYAIAQYNTPLKRVARVNEVWVTLSGPLISDLCEVLPSNFGIDEISAS